MSENLLRCARYGSLPPRPQQLYVALYQEKDLECQSRPVVSDHMMRVATQERISKVKLSAVSCAFMSEHGRVFTL